MTKKNILYILLLTFSFGIDYYNEIQPMFNQNCVDCHVGNSPSGGLNLTNYENLMNKIDLFSAVVSLPNKKFKFEINFI